MELLTLAKNNDHEGVYNFLKNCNFVNDGNFLNAKDTDNTSLFYAVYYKNSEMVRILLKCQDIEINNHMRYGDTYFMHACRNGYTIIIKHFLERKDLEINSLNKDGLSSLMLACINGKLINVKMISEFKGIDLNIENSGFTASMMARINRHFDIVKFLHFQNVENVKIKINTMREKYYSTEFLICLSKQIYSDITDEEIFECVYKN